MDIYKKNNELAVITKAKDLCAYIMNVTQKSPKQYRFTFVSRLQNIALDIIENLYRANDTFVTKERTESASERLNYQHKALTDIRLLAYFSLLAFENGCVLSKQYEQISIQATDCINMVGAWISSDRKRLSPNTRS